MSQEITPELIASKNLQRAALKKEYLRQFTNPHSEGHVFDPAVQRYISLQVSRVNHFRETPKTVLSGLFLIVLPIAATMYFFKNKRDQFENEIRTGKVAYKDRLFKFQ